jgi:hypothetical protein
VAAVAARAALHRRARPPADGARRRCRAGARAPRRRDADAPRSGVRRARRQSRRHEPRARGPRIVDRTTVTGFQPATYVLVENERYALLWNPSGEPLAWPGELARTVPLPRVALFDRAADPGFFRDVAAERPLVLGALRVTATSGGQTTGATPSLSTEARQLLMQAGYLDEPLE